MTNKENFYKATEYIKREGIKDLITWLENSDFFTSPASTEFHGNYDGGLLDHTMNVLQFALYNFNYLIKQKPELEYLKESVVICALFHDLCKVNTYVKKQKWTKDEEGKWKEYFGYKPEDKFPFGHGEKSVYIISKFMKLTDLEAMAIRWHMGSTETSVNSFNSPQAYAYYAAIEHPLVRLIHCADMLSLMIEEKKDLKNV